MQDSRSGGERKAAKGVHIFGTEEGNLHRHLDKTVRGMVKETLNGFMDAVTVRISAEESLLPLQQILEDFPE
jgi:hypothetical protein